MSDCDVLFVNNIGPGFSLATTREPKGLGGSELEIVQTAHALARRGHKVIVANGVTVETKEDGVRYIPFAQAEGMQTEALWIERFCTPPPSIKTRRIIIRATDIDWDPYNVHRHALTEGIAAVVVNTQWQYNSGFGYAKEKIIIPPALDYDLGPGPAPEKIPGKFVFVSAPMKGLDLSLEMWRKFARKYDFPKMKTIPRLHVIVPGFSDMYGDLAQKLTGDDEALGISFGGMVSLVEWRRLVASAEGLFFVSQMNETFGCVAAFAEHYGTRPHILCRANVAGFDESLTKETRLKFVTENEQEFEKTFMEALLQPHEFPKTRDLSPDVLVADWEKALHLKPGLDLSKHVRAGIPQGSPDPTPAAVAASAVAQSEEDEKLLQEDLPENRTPMGPEFGHYLSSMRSALSVGGSEFGLGLMLMSLVASVRATRIVEIGRYRGFSTISMAAGLALADAGWQEPTFARQRPDVDYDNLLAKKKRTLISIDKHPNEVAAKAIKDSSLEQYVELVDQASDDVDLSTIGVIDVLLIDGCHEIEHLRRDIARFVPHVRPGGYFLLHDYFGWYKDGVNNSPIKKAVDEELAGFERVLIDTGFASFVMLRKTIDLPPQPKRVPPRADGKPTVGLVLIAHGDEAATIIARAIVSAKKIVDCVTVVADGGEKMVEVCRALGADVYLRATPEFDWVKGDGSIARARNEALSIAERKTDYVLLLDPDDYFEGELPKDLTADVYELFIHDSGLRYPRAQLLKSGKGFHYTGIAHEHLVCAGSVARITTLKYIRGHGGHQDRNPPEIKYAIHAKWFEKWLIDHPDDTRAQFYLAQSYRDSRQYDKAIAAYERRIEMSGGIGEEPAFSACQIARILRETGKDPTQAFLRAFEMRPTRAEPLAELANWLRDDKQKRFALAVVVARMAASLKLPESDYLFINPRIYEFGALEELAISLYWVGDKVGAKSCYEQLLNRVPKEYTGHIRNMLALCEREIRAAK